MNHKKSRLYWRASYTIEAACIMPIVLLVICGVITLAFDLHEQVRQSTDEENLTVIHTMEEVRRIEYADTVSKKSEPKLYDYYI